MWTIIASAAEERSLFIETKEVDNGRYILRPVYVQEREGKKYLYSLAPLAAPVVQQAYRAKIRELNPDGRPYDEMVFECNWMGDPLSMLVTFH